MLFVLLLLCLLPMGALTQQQQLEKKDLSGYQVVRVKTESKVSKKAEDGSSSNNNNSTDSVMDSLDRIFNAVLEDAEVLMYVP